MKLAKLTMTYPGYIRDFYALRPELAANSYGTQMTALFEDAFGWGNAWQAALEPLGYDVRELIINAAPAQRQWAREAGIALGEADPLSDIVIEQLRRFKPEILWYDHHDALLLRRIRAEIKSIRTVIGWVGSAMPATDCWRDIDLVLSCAPESVERLQAAGHRARHFNHGFDARIYVRLPPLIPTSALLFIGSIVRAREFHYHREEILEAVVRAVPLTIYSPASEDAPTSLRGRIRETIAGCAEELLPRGILRSLQSSAPRWTQRRVHPALACRIRPPLFGMAMYRATRDSQVCLNIHADSSPRFAGNMRLFETTGVGSCLLTDWKENLPILFRPDTEVITYRTPEECAEKAHWLIEHPAECKAIGSAARRRVLAEHTFNHRALELHEILRRQKP